MTGSSLAHSPALPAADSPLVPRQPWRVVACGSTERTLACLESVAADPRFTIVHVVTPPPRPVGRKQVLTPSPVQLWAEAQHVPVLNVDRSLREVRDSLEALHADAPIDFLLVVDFGYLVPAWLLNMPLLGPINVHPSDLPAFRGSSPGTFALLYGLEHSAVCIMRMDVGLDTGPIIARLPFAVPPQATQTEYYQSAFSLVKQHLPDVLAQYAIDQRHQEQPSQSPTLEAARLTKDDGFLPYALLVQATSPATARQPVAADELQRHSSTMQAVLHATQPSVREWVDRMTRALLPWPGAWTVFPHTEQTARAKIVRVQWHDQLLESIELQIAGEARPRVFLARELPPLER